MIQPVNRYEWRRDGVFLPFELVEEARKEGWLRSLALFVQMKGMYRNGVFYNYTSRKLSGVLSGELSHTSVNKHIGNLLQKGLVTRKGKHIALTGYGAMTARWGKRVVFINQNSSNSTVYYTLLAQKVISNIRSQENRVRKAQRDVTARNRILNTKIVESGKNYISLSDRCVSELIGTSNGTSNRLKKVWQETGLIRLRALWEDLGTMSESQFTHMRELGLLPVYAKYHRTSKKAVRRLQDGVCLGYTPYTKERYTTSSYFQSHYSQDPIGVQ